MVCVVMKVAAQLTMTDCHDVSPTEKAGIFRPGLGSRHWCHRRV